VRYGIVRDGRQMASPALQRRLLERLDCDVLWHEGEPTAEAQRRLLRALQALKAGDELAVQSLEAFQKTTGELVQMLRNLLDAGVTLYVVRSSEEVLTLTATHPGLPLLHLLAEHERGRPGRAPVGLGPRQNSGSRNPLSKYQIDYARKMHREGATLRAIGLLFQVSPNEVWEAIGD
jgi:DNA invertase Pin-like site-specific DNA recombinase